MEQLLKDIQARLIGEVPALLYVDEDWGQLDYYQERPPVKWPCALVDVGQALWSNTLKKAQMGLVQVKVRVADLKLSNTSKAAPQSQKDKAFAIWATLADIHKALHGWTGSRHYSKLIRTNTTRIKREDGVRIYEITYTTQLVDTGAMTIYNTATGVLPVVNTAQA